MLNAILDQPIQGVLQGGGPCDDVVLSSRIRLARNWKGLRFPNAADDATFREGLQRMRHLLPELMKQTGRAVGMLEMAQLSPLERSVLVEKHIISPHLSDHPEQRALVVSEDAAIAIMVHEEDHLRIQVLRGGLQLEDAYQEAKGIDDTIEAQYDIAFSESFGYLTACPTNVGTGLRASVMVHVPALALTKRIHRLIRGIVQLGYTVRGLYGEGSSPLGHVYQISNQLTMGLGEEDTIAQLHKVVEQLVKEERACRQRLYEEDPVALEDRVYRAFGIASQARCLSGDEALTYLSEVELGRTLGLLPKNEKCSFTELLVRTRPHFLQKSAGRDTLTPRERDVLRAQVVRDRMTC